MYITVYNLETKESYNTKFDCRQCVYGNYCRDAGYKGICEFYDDMRSCFRIISQVPYFTTGEPRLIHINIKGNISLDKARCMIDAIKRCYIVHKK